MTRLHHKLISRLGSFLLLVALSPFARAQAVDVQSFQGLWHEVARSPNLFQRRCQSSTAEYRLQANGKLQVTNRCATSNGGCKVIQGSAVSTNPPCNNRLIVSLNAPFARGAERRGKVNYQILHVSPDYQSAVVGTPGRRLVWILSRDPNPSAGQLNHLKTIARAAGYRTDNLVGPGR